MTFVTTDRVTLNVAAIMPMGEGARRPVGEGVMMRNRSRALLSVLLTMALTGAFLVLPGHAAPPSVTGSETDLGVQIPGRAGEVRSEQSDQGPLADGRHLTYFANSGGPGTPARFFAMDLAGRTVAEVAIPRGTDVRTLTYSAARRTVFVAANDASVSHLYEWDGTALREVTSITGQQVMRLASAPDGALYIGTFANANGRLYEWSGGRLRDHGQPIAGESYVRSLVADATSVWVSNYRERGARLVRVDRSSGARTTISTPTAFAAEWSALDMSRAGDYLFLRTVNSALLFAYHVPTNRFVDLDDQVARVNGTPEVRNPVPHITGISPHAISPLLQNRYVYFQRANAGLMRIDLQAGLKAVRVDRYHEVDNRQPWPGASVAGPASYAWLSNVPGRAGSSLVVTSVQGELVVNTPGQTTPLRHRLAATGAPSTIITLGTDGAGAVYSSGFDLPTGIGRHVPGAGSTLLDGPQIEGFGQFDGRLVMGGYTGDTSSGPLYEYAGTGQPRLRRHLDNSQERPVALTQVGRQVAIGSVPIKNVRGGALSLWDPATNALTVRRDLIPEHSIISLVEHRGLLVGGSSNTGGTGAEPAASDGEIFTYHPGTGALTRVRAPKPQSATYSWVAAITPDPTAADHFWAISTGMLVQFRVGANGAITVTRNLGMFSGTSSPTGKGLGIEFVDGTMFATVGGTLSAVNTVTGETTVVAPTTSTGPVVGLVKVGGDDLYYARGARLYRYRVSSASTSTQLAAPAVTSPSLTAPVPAGSVSFSGTGTRGSRVTVSDGSRSRSAVVQTGGTWALAPMTFSAGTHQLTFTAELDGFSPTVTRATMSVVAPTFRDVSAGHPFLAEIQWLATHGITTGYPDGTFRPRGTVTREAMAAFMYRLAGSPPYDPPARSPFPDVATSHPFYREIAWLSTSGVTTGYADGTFRPRQQISRDAMAAFMYRLAGSPSYRPPGSARFTDVPTGHPFYAEVSWLAERGISTGYRDGTYKPRGNVTREAMAAFMGRYAAGR